MKVRIGHLDFDVRRMSDEDRDKDNSALGRCHMHRGLIALNWHRSPQEEAATLVHEVLHAIHHTYCVRTKMSEEEVCRTLEGPLVAFMADNPHVVAAIIAARMGVPLPIPNTL